MAARIAEKAEIPYNSAHAAGWRDFRRAADADSEAARKTTGAVMQSSSITPHFILENAKQQTRWQCPYCKHYAIAQPLANVLAIVSAKHGGLVLLTSAFLCMNPECRELEITASVVRTPSGEIVELWTLLPRSQARPFPAYIPEAIRKDYEEACAIIDLSPKASATLSRRCLQGMIRDFHGVKKRRNLKQEIESIKDKVDATTWNAIDSVRKIGNIGAHMEKDVSLIIDVEPKEAQLLIKLNELLLKEWYINREERTNLLRVVVDAAKTKEVAKKAGQTQTPPNMPAAED